MTQGSSISRLVVSLAAAALAGSVRAQSPQVEKPEVFPAASVDVVRIDVVVTDKGGHAQAGLAREDFSVLEDGVPQALVQFEAFTRERRALPAGTEPIPVVGEGLRRARPRHVVLMVDDVHIELANLTRVKKALTRFLEEEFDPEDLVALVTTSGARAHHEFTTDRAVLRHAVSRLTARELRPEQLWSPRLSEYQAELIERGDAEALDVAVQEILHERPTEPDPETVARLKARRVLEQAIFSAQLTLETTESVIRGMGRLPGRKVLFLLSDGFITGLTAGSPLGFDIRRITDSGTRAGVVVYGLETRGLTVQSIGGSASSRGPYLPRGVVNTLALTYSMQRRGEEATRSAMNALAADTGGFLVHSSNDLRSGLKQLLEDMESYYVLAYEPANRKRDGAFRRIEVRLPNRKGLKVRTRSGYFASDDHHAVSRPAANPVRLSVDFVSLESGASELVLSGHVDATMLSFVQEGERSRATIEMLATVADARGVVVATLPPQRAALDLSEAEHVQVLKSGFAYQNLVPLKPGRYRARLIARGLAGRLGGVEQWGEVPDLAAGGLTLSSVFLLRESGTGAPASPEGGQVLQNAQALRRFRRDENLYAQVYVYNARRDASGATDLVLQAEVLREGVVLATGAPEAMATSEPQGPFRPHTSRIKIHPFDPGDYELRLTVTDRNGNQTASRLADFRID